MRKHALLTILILAAALAPDAGTCGEGGGLASKGLPPGLMGMPLPHRTVEGVRVDLFLLQASYTEGLPPDAPNHRITVMLRDAETGQLIPGGSVSLEIAGAGESLRIDLPSVGRYYQGGARLAELGDYRIVVAFDAKGRSGKAEFTYRMIPAPPPHAHGKDPEPVIQGE